MIFTNKRIEDQEYLLYFALIVFHIVAFQWWQLAPWAVLAIVMLQLPLLVFSRKRMFELLTRPIQLIILFIWLAVLWMRTPYMANHLLFEGLVILVLIITSLIRLAKRQNIPRVRFRHFRMALPILYILAALQKCNTDFLDSAYSAHVLEGAIMHRLGSGMQLPSLVLALGTILLELSAGILLLLSRTRKWGIALALVMHVLFAMTGDAGIISFSMLGVVWLSFFLPKSRRKVMILWPVSIALVGISQFDYTLRMTALELSFYIIVVMFIWDWFTVNLDENSEQVKLPQQVLIGLLLFNFLTPYLGLKSAQAFNMFSDLKVSASTNNHLWMPQLTVFPYLKESYPVNEIETDCEKVATNLNTRASSTTTHIQLTRSLMRNCGSQGAAMIAKSEEVTGADYLEYHLLERKLVVFE